MGNERLCELIEAVAKDQDKSAFSELFAYFFPRIRAYAVRGGSGSTEADELAQETMLTVWRRAASFDRTKAAVSTWMFAIIRNKRIDRVRRVKHYDVDLEEAEQLSVDTADPGEAYDMARAGSALRETMKSLPLDQLTILQKAYFEHKTHVEIAEELQLPLGTVKSRIRLALKKLRVSPLKAYA